MIYSSYTFSITFPSLTDNEEACRKYAVSRVNLCRSFSNGTFMQGLNSNVHSEKEKMMIVDKLFDRMTKILKENPLGYGIKYDTYFMIIQKK